MHKQANFLNNMIEDIWYPYRQIDFKIKENDILHFTLTYVLNPIGRKGRLNFYFQVLGPCTLTGEDMIKFFCENFLKDILDISLSSVSWFSLNVSISNVLDVFTVLQNQKFFLKNVFIGQVEESSVNIIKNTSLIANLQYSSGDVSFFEYKGVYILKENFSDFQKQISQKLENRNKLFIKNTKV